MKLVSIVSIQFCVAAVAVTTPRAYADDSSSEWFGNPMSSSSSSRLPPPPPSFSQQQDSNSIPDCSLDVFENNGDIVRTETIIVDGCLIDCGGQPILTAVPYGSVVIVRNSGHVKDCPLKLVTGSTTEDATSVPTSLVNDNEVGTTGFLCDKGDCTLTGVKCDVASELLVFIECVLVTTGAESVTINGGLVTDREKLISLYGIVVNAGSETDEITPTVKLFVHGVTIMNQYFDGIKILDGINTIQITDSIMSFNRRDGIEMQGGSGLKYFAIIGCTFEYNLDDGIDVGQYERNPDIGYLEEAVMEILITDVIASFNREDGILIERANKVTIDEVIIDGNKRTGIDIRVANVINLQGVTSKNNAHNGFSSESIAAEISIVNSIFLTNGKDLKNSAAGMWKRSGVYIWLPKSLSITNAISNENRMDGFCIYDCPVLNITNVDAMRNDNDGIRVRESSEAFGYDYSSGSDYLVGAYYYPWHGDDFHNGGGYLRKDLIPPQLPMLGEYDDSDRNVISQHLKWFRKANIGLLVTSWWGPDRVEDTNTRQVIMEHDQIGNLKIALHYETTGRIKNGEDMTVPRADIQYMCDNYFDHPNYYKIQGRPVVVMYISRKLHKDGVLAAAILTMRSEASKCGHHLYLIGDQVFAKAPDEDEPFIPFIYFDAVTNYDVYGSSGAGKQGPYAGKEAIDNYYAEQKKWRELAIKENCRYIPPVSPGYNDRGVRLEADHPPLSRKLTEFQEEGSLFQYQLQNALPLVDPAVDNMILVNSFNEWHEDTQIEPTSVGGYATKPEILTGGLEYVSYGELYLDILSSETSKSKKESVVETIMSSSKVYFANVHTCSNQYDGVTFYITDDDSNDDKDFSYGDGVSELFFTPGPNVVSCKNKRYDFELHGGGNFVFNNDPAMGPGYITGDTCANGSGVSDCTTMLINKCNTSNRNCRHRSIISSGGAMLNKRTTES